MNTLSDAEIRQLYNDSAPVPRGQFRAANQALTRFVQAARAALDDRINQKLAELTQLFDQQTARIEAKISAIRDGKDADEQQIASNVLQQVLKQIRQPKDGDTPVIDYSRIVREVLPLLPAPHAAKDGISPDPEVLLTQLEARLPALGIAIHDALKLLPEEERPSISLFSGVEDYMKQLIARYADYSGNAVIPVMLSGTIKNHAASALNFKGAGAPTVTVGPNGRTDLNFPPSSGSVTVETPTGTVNGSNTQFTPTSQPKWVVADGTTYYEGVGYSWDGTHINMDIGPSEFIRDIL